MFQRFVRTLGVRSTTLVGSDAARTAEVARSLECLPHGTDWRDLIESPYIDAVSIAVPPALQASMIVHAAASPKARVLREAVSSALLCPD